MRIEFFQLVDAGAEHVGNLLEVNVAVDDDGVGLGRQFRAHGADVVLAVVVHHIVCSDEGGHIASCLARQIGVDDPIVVLSFGTVDGLVDVFGSAVVGCDDEVPVAEDFVEVAQIACGGPRGLQRVAPFVDQRVHFKTVLLTGGEHELPQPGSAYMRHGVGVETRLNDGQVFQFERQAVGFECFLEDGHIEVAATEHDADRLATVFRVAVDEFPHNVVVGHFHHGGQLAQTQFINIVFKIGVFVGAVAVGIGLQVGLRGVEFEQAVHFGCHGFGQVDDFGFAFCVDDGNLGVVLCHCGDRAANEHCCNEQVVFFHYSHNFRFVLN